jgi:ABC-type sugar transport system ATPase subunit
MALLLEMRGIDKRFPGIKALDGVDFDLRAGEVHALLGENGAGKSTLIKILGGIYQKDAGTIAIEGRPAAIGGVNEARLNGISIIHQELVLVPQLSVAENVFLGREPRTKSGLVDYRLMREQCAAFFAEFAQDIDPRRKIRTLSIAQQQMVEIVKAISFKSRVIVMDEPTSSIMSRDVEALFNSIRSLKRRGIGIIYISHRMSELQEIADRVTILRDGKWVGTKNVAETTNDELIALMVGRSMTGYFTRTFNTTGDIVLKVENLTTAVVSGVSFELRRGEILGFSGLVGAGRTEAMLGLMGLDRMLAGSIYVNGRKISKNAGVHERIRQGIMLVPEDRKAQGLFPIRTLRFNLSLKAVRQFIHGIVSDGTGERRIAKEGIKKLSIRAANDLVPIGLLSGGNQQKAILASWLALDPGVLILDEPTRGIDVGAKSEIYAIMNKLAKSGVGIIMISSELPEVINMSDRVAVMREGRIQAILDRTEISQERIMQYAVAM